MQGGMQSVLINEYDKSNKFYKMFMCEAIIRGLASRYQNSYMITIFACCRQIYRQSEMTNCISEEMLKSIKEEETKALEQSQNEKFLNELIELGRGEIEVRGSKGQLQAAYKERQNFLFMWGCRPSDGVAAKTEMVGDLINTLMNFYDKSNLTFVIPQGFEHLKGKDVNFEMVTSNTIQPV